jgi:hypothetical protein
MIEQINEREDDLAEQAYLVFVMIITLYRYRQMFAVHFLIFLLQMQFSLLPTFHAYIQTKKSENMWCQKGQMKVQKI